MLGAEAVKIISARLANAEVLVLTWNADGYFNYKLLNQDLEEKWFHGQKNVQIQHMTDFIKNFVQEHGHDFSPEQTENFQEASTGRYGYNDGQRFKDVLVDICEALNNQNKNFVIMMDEVVIEYVCRKTTEKEGQTSFHMDFSYLAKYQNIHFVICLKPAANDVKDFKMTCPPLAVTSPSSDDASAAAKPIQHYQELKVTHRCSLPILKHIREFQKNDPNEPGPLDIEKLIR